jgi:DNA polymerase III alpha subunit
MMLEDETGTSNAIFAPDFYESNRSVITHGSILLIEGELQNLDRTISVKMKRVEELHLSQLKTVSRDFH